MHYLCFVLYLLFVHSGCPQQSNTTKTINECMYSLSQVCGGMHVEGAIEQVQALQTELDDIRRSAVNGSLVPLPGETVSIF